MRFLTFDTDPIAIPLLRQWAFKWSAPCPIGIMVPGLRIHIRPLRFPFGYRPHLTAGRWKSYIRGRSWTLLDPTP